ncbi:MAG: FmdB family transcriptional regulator [Gemmatimonadetes bacterium]|nr:FmdB family transcriptional regulator [Gemmatimonadota bacterium]
MPTYEYRCTKGHGFENFVLKMSDAQSVLPCPTCGERGERHMSAGGGLVFKGSGFYITDYGKDGKKAQGQDKGDSAKSDGGKAESSSSDSAKSDGAKAEGSKSDGARSEGSKSEGSKSDGAKSEGGKSDAAKSGGAKSDVAKPAATKPDSASSKSAPGKSGGE